MKRCPTCNRTFEDPNLSFCLDDGTPLIPVANQGETVSSTSPRQTSDTSPQSESHGARDWAGPAYQPPGAYVPSSGGRKRRVWPWLLGIGLAVLVGLIGLAIVAAVMVPMMFNSNANRRTANANAPAETANVNENTNLNNANSAVVESNDNSETGNYESSVPTDEAVVLSTLTNLEHEWTVANINANKKKLDEILADDYVGTDLEGKVIGKAEYIRTIERDTVTQDWSFEDLKLELKGDRATLTGIVNFTAQANKVAFRFTDKFIWRDGRWQAIGSEISRI